VPDHRLVEFYNAAEEHDRLTSNAVGQLEFTRTVSLLTRHLPPPPARVLDIGGGSGPYSEFLGGRGYEVHLLDAVPKHVDQAARRPGIASARVADARELPWPANFADAVLVMGPLYHLEERTERVSALREAFRVVKPGGVLAAAAISRFAAVLDGLARGFIDDPRFRPILLGDLVDGHHRNPTGNLEYFTSGHFHRADELAAEATEAGFENPRIFAVEGPAWAAPDLEERWADPEKRRFLLDVLERIEGEPSLIGASAHQLAVACKPSPAI
jgi:ubiquinone/menaquinone biosynthesis C-methylase UbiE